MINLRFAIPVLMLVIAIGTFLLGGYWLWTGLLILTLVPRVMDFIIGDVRKSPANGPAWLMDTFQLAVVPLLAILTLQFLYYIGDARMAWLEVPAGWIGSDLAAARAATNPVGLLGGLLTLGMYHGATGVIVGHEFIHRPDHRVMRALGKWLIAPTCFSALILEHLKGHHINAAIPGDPETAARGRGFWRFMVENFVATNRDAFAREKARLDHKNSGWFDPGNRLLQGYALSALVAGLFGLAAGWPGLGAFVVVAGLGTLCTTLFSYIAHYGLVRVPGTRLAARHSWNSYRFWSTSNMFNLTRHASHHLHGDWPYWKLQAEPRAPIYPYGPTVMAGIALVPPLWRKAMAGPLQDWDQNMATRGELALLEGVDMTGRLRNSF